jgi:hypothetical protein
MEEAITMSMWRLMTQEITVERYAGVNAYGAPTFSPAKKYRGRVILQTRRIPDDRGDEVVSIVTVYLDTRDYIGTMDRVTLPTGFSPGQPKIIKVSQPMDRRSVHHTALYC